MPTKPRRLGTTSWEHALAGLATAGLRFLKQTTHTATLGVDTTYTITEETTRRLVIVHLAAANGDIRIAYNEAATATSFPVIPARYFVVDCEKGDVIHFFNTTAAGITVNVLEIT